MSDERDAKTKNEGHIATTIILYTGGYAKDSQNSTTVPDLLACFGPVFSRTASFLLFNPTPTRSPYRITAFII